VILGLPGTDQLEDVLRRGPEALVAAAEEARRNPVERVDYAGADLAAPLQPGSIRDSLGFLDHLRNARGGVIPEQFEQFPPFYFSNVAGLLGARDEVRIFPGSERFDFELEVGAVIGTRAESVAPATAMEHLAGLMIFCDWSARDTQAHDLETGLGPTKSKDGANTLGPLFVTVDELEPFLGPGGFHLEMQAWVNGERLSHGWLDTMDWSFAEMISFASRGTVLLPGDVIGSGTVPSGCLMERLALHGEDAFPGWLQPGDQVRLRVDQLGEIEQVVAKALPVQPLRTGW
jgi:2-keto-4-pentenoate hydratase/2-oxohepta-3-ene-1,7-dioic acid hydratase in catechol pathway